MAEHGCRGLRRAMCVVLWWAGSLMARADAVATVTPAAFQGQVAAAQGMVRACGMGAYGCSAEKLPAEERVDAEPGVPAFRVSWQWLREAMGAAGKQAAMERAATMRTAEAHLAEWASDAGTADEAARFGRERRSADTVLASGEFRAVDGPTWWDQQWAKAQDWFLRLFSGMDRLGARNPWLAPAIEWSCFLLAAAGLVFFIRRSLQRQSLRIALAGDAVTATRTGRDSTDWARLAEEQAAVGAWREAVHSVYWAAVEALEAKRAWRANPARTPREYLRLLAPGSKAQGALRELTRSFERVWYGQAEADEAMFRAASESFRVLQAADLRRGAEHAGDAGAAPAGAAAAGAA